MTYDAAVFNNDYPMSRGARARVKHAITHDPRWPRYRQTALGGCNANDLHKRDLYAACDDLGKDVWRLIFDAPMTKPDFPDDFPFEPPQNPMSVGALAERLGVTRQRVYNMIKRGWIKAERVNGATLIIQPDEVTRVLDAVVQVRTRKGVRTRFDFI